MIRSACLLLALLALPIACVASPPATVAPVAETRGPCEAKPADPVVAEAASPTDAPLRNADTVPSRPASARSPGTVRTATPRWNRLLPGMFR